MRNIYLVFRRDYLGYVKAWGFWLSLAAVPLFLIVGASFGYFAATASPTSGMPPTMGAWITGLTARSARSPT